MFLSIWRRGSSVSVARFNRRRFSNDLLVEGYSKEIRDYRTDHRSYNVTRPFKNNVPRSRRIHATLSISRVSEIINQVDSIPAEIVDPNLYYVIVAKNLSILLRLL